MPLLMLKDLPRYECLLECAKRFPEMDPDAATLFMHLLRTADELFEVKADFMRRHNISWSFHRVDAVVGLGVDGGRRRFQSAT